ncbi:MAG: hypothetical protein JOZ05_00005, partial [Acetobacteraceae bacterium]|nr:hypothetical protein [Acetobacteraceae bacterium]
LLQAVTGQERGHLERLLQELSDHALITAAGQGPDGFYAFRHVLIQEAAYRSLLGPRRRGLHREIATVLERLGDGVEPEQVALHHGRAGQHEKALEWYQKAALRARGRYALAERVQHLRRAVAHARTLEDGSPRPERELQLLIELGLALIDHRGSGHDEVQLTFERARELCLQLRDHERLVVALDALALNCHFARSESAQVLRYAAELDHVAEAARSPLAALWASRMRSSARLLRGELEAARAEMDSVIARYRELEAETGRTRTARDPRASTYGNLAICLTVQGRVVEGRAAADAGIQHAERSNSVPTLMASLRRGCLQGMIVRDEARVLELATRLLAVNAEHETFTGLREGTIALGWAKIGLRGEREALRSMLASLDQLEEARHFVYLPFLMCAVAERAWQVQDRDSALGLLQRASALAERTTEVWCEPELLRLRATLAKERTKAVALLEQSLTVARTRGAAWWELRAATDFAALQVQAGLGAHGRELLGPILARYHPELRLADLDRAAGVLAATNERPIPPERAGVAPRANQVQ